MPGQQRCMQKQPGGWTGFSLSGMEMAEGSLVRYVQEHPTFLAWLVLWKPRRPINLRFDTLMNNSWFCKPAQSCCWFDIPALLGASLSSESDWRPTRLPGLCSIALALLYPCHGSLRWLVSLRSQSLKVLPGLPLRPWRPWAKKLDSGVQRWQIGLGFPSSLHLVWIRLHCTSEFWLCTFLIGSTCSGLCDRHQSPYHMELAGPTVLWPLEHVWHEGSTQLQPHYCMFGRLPVGLWSDSQMKNKAMRKDN